MLACDGAGAMGGTRGCDCADVLRVHAPLVRRLARQTHLRCGGAIDVEDLEQTGMLALTEASRSFEDRGVAAFSTYATVRVRGAMLDSLRRQAPLNRGAFRRRRALEAAKAAGGGAVDHAALAAQLGITRQELARVEADTAMPRTESLDAAYSDHDPCFAADDPDAFDMVSHGRLRDALARAIRALSEREALVLQLCFLEELSLEQVGEVLGVGAPRVCQIKKAAVAKLRRMLADWA